MIIARIGMNPQPATESSPRLEAAVAEYFEALEQHQEPDRAALLARYADVADELASFFEDHDCLNRHFGGGSPSTANGATAVDATWSFTAATLDQPSPRGEPQRPLGSVSAWSNCRLGPYELLAELGRGGMGIVYKARHSELNRIVALKTIQAGHLASAEDRHRFASEARAAAHLDHAGIVPIFEVSAAAGMPYLAMQFVEGESLASRLRSGPLPARQAARLLRKLAMAVAHAHARGIVHRDLKPGNVLLAPTEQDSGDSLPLEGGCEPRITDFGLAKRLDDTAQLTTSGQILGTPGYMAPEQAAGRNREIGIAADIYGLGAILYAMLTAEPPFRSDNPIEVILQVLEREPTLPSKLNPQVPRELEWICLKCLEKKPADRYASALELAADLDRFLCHEPPHARRWTLSSRLRRWVRRKPVLAGHVIALLAPLAVSQTFFILSPHRDLAYHARLSGLLIVWMLSSGVCQWLIERERSSPWPLYLWCGADAAFLTGLLCLVPPPSGVLACGYLLLICVTALAGQIRLVAFTTACSILAYIGLILLRPDDAPPLPYTITLLLTFALTGLALGYQVWRLRVMHEYWNDRRAR